jgi:hypothetical protein
VERRETERKCCWTYRGDFAQRGHNNKKNHLDDDADVPVVGDRAVTTMPNYLSEIEGDIVGRLEGGAKGNRTEVLLDVLG